jgi:hypothetical protein
VKRRRRRRGLVSLAAALAIVVAQSASLAFACTRAAEAFPGHGAAMTSCPEHRAADPAAPGAAIDNLCEVHCQAASPPSPALVAFAPPPATLLVVAPPPALDEGQSAEAPAVGGAGPPPRTRYCRLQL